MLKINYFALTNNDYYLISIFDKEAERLTLYHVKQDFSPYPCIEKTTSKVVSRGFRKEFHQNETMIIETEYVHFDVKVSNIRQIDLLLSAQKDGADYPDGFREKLKEMKNTIEKNELLNGIKNFVYVDSLLQLAKEYPKEIREFINQCLSSNFIKSFSKELLQVMNGEKKLFSDLSKIARLYPDMFQSFIKDCTDTIPDSAPTVPRPI